MKPETIYMIRDMKTGEHVGSYDRSYGDKYHFNSASEAINHNCHGLFKDRDNYRISEYKVTYELVNDDA